MSGHLVLFQASRAIRNALFTKLSEAKISGLQGDASQAISLFPPAAQSGVAASPPFLSLWLYFVSENEHCRNRPPTIAANGSTQSAPLALTLYYLVTPSPGAAADEAAMERAERVLGVVLQAFHQNPVIPVVNLAGEMPEAREELHLSLCRLSVEELTRIWDALDRPYQLSVCFKVNIVRIESVERPGSLVKTREFIAGRLQQVAP
jgi:hypothetical protein